MSRSSKMFLTFGFEEQDIAGYFHFKAKHVFPVFSVALLNGSKNSNFFTLPDLDTNIHEILLNDDK